jgi:hypothetical protein
MKLKPGFVPGHPDTGVANVCFVRSADLHPAKMLHGARMAGLVKLQRGTRSAGQRRLWAGIDAKVCGQMTIWGWVLQLLSAGCRWCSCQRLVNTRTRFWGHRKASKPVEPRQEKAEPVRDFNGLSHK